MTSASTTPAAEARDTALEREAHREIGVYAKRRIQLVRGEGALVEGDQGRRYVDCCAGIGVANVGPANPRVVAAIARQAERLITCPEMFYNDARAAYLERLAAVLPAGWSGSSSATRAPRPSRPRSSSPGS